MELGVNAPFIVLDDTDPDQAIEAAMVCKFRRSGQTSVVDDFTKRLVKQLQTLKRPLVHSAAVQKIDGHVRDAIRKGAVLLLTNASTQMDVARDETFGPLAAIFALKTEDEAEDMSNATEYGLAAPNGSDLQGCEDRVGLTAVAGILEQFGNISAALVQEKGFSAPVDVRMGGVLFGVEGVGNNVLLERTDAHAEIW
ncbi:hypothetical protein FDECE_12596 [Fusarium decemcellulare]|nr:hypothetical protein FDECE_12596 [Fusarium decemcellulare]